MKVIKLKEVESNFLRSLDCDDISVYLDNSYFDLKSSSYILGLTIQDIEKVSEILTLILAEKGVTDGEINYVGKQIDDLLNKFNPYY
jgi:hypothetical protein